MERVKRLLADEEYQDYLQKIAVRELDREFCGHNIEHCFAVARICYILWLEAGCPEKGFIDKEVIYVTALLHDIGRWQQYDFGYDHAWVSGELARDILRKLNFSPSQIEMMTEAIAAHRRRENGRTLLAQLLYKADKRARVCPVCPVKEKCYKYETLANQDLY